MKYITLVLSILVLQTNIYADKYIDSLLNIVNSDTASVKIKISNNYNIANVYSDMGEYNLAIEHYNKSLAGLKYIKEDTLKFHALIIDNIGLVYYYQGYYKKALNNCLEAQKIYESIDEDVTTTYSYLALIYKGIKDYKQSLLYFNKCIKIYEEQGNTDGLSNLYNNVGILYYEQKKYETALDYYAKSFKLYKEINDITGEMAVYNNIGLINVERGKFIKAKENFNKVIELRDEYNINDVKLLVVTYLNLAFLLNGEAKVLKDTIKQRNKYLQAIDYANKALPLVKENNSLRRQKEIYEDIVIAYEGLKDIKNELHYHKLLTSIKDSLYNVEMQNEIKDIQTAYKLEKKDNEIKLIQKEKQLQIILIILILGLVIFVITITLLRVRQKQKNKINKLEKRSLKVETQMLRSQMNPHFIFNSLNSIQSFISENETIDAERYLSKFAKLMRLILDNSRQSFIPMDNEINTLNLYLELEKLRFNNKFEYTININDIDDEFTEVPPMLAQPYIENAILHGVNSINNGKITIDYKQKNNKIICTIDDNGIGRKKSAEIKRQTDSKRKSLGIKVTQERIELLSDEYGMIFNISIIDKFDNDIALGTKIIIEMPFKD